MPFPRNSMDLLICSIHPDSTVLFEKMNELNRLWIQRGFINEDSHCIETSGLIKGGFHRLDLDHSGLIKLYANHQGGYRVFCPDVKGNIASEFSSAVSSWRGGAPRLIQCPACGSNHPLEDVELRPKGAFSMGAIIFRAVESIELTNQAACDLDTLLGKWRVVLRRIG